MTTPRFTTLMTAHCGSEQAIQPATVRWIDNVISLVFDTPMHAELLPGRASSEESHVWRMAVLDVHLPTATRRPFVAYLRGAMHVVHGRALLRISADGRTTSRQLLARHEQVSADQTVALHIRRSTQPRDRLRLHVWIEVDTHADGGEALATVDALDVLAR